MRFRGLIKPLIASNEFEEVLSNIKNIDYPIGVNGLSQSGRGYFIDSLYEEVGKSLLILVGSDVEAKDIYEDISLYSTSVYYFPTKEVVFYNIDAVSGDLRWERLKILREMVRKSRKIIVTSIEALAARYTPLKLFKSGIFKLTLGDTIDFSKIEKELVQSGYERADMVEEKGQFSIRGGIFDIFPPGMSLPYRVELFGDEIDSIRSFNMDTQRSIDKVNSFEFYPAKEVILTSTKIEEGYKKIEAEYKEVFNKQNDNKDLQRKLKEVVGSNLESLKENWSFETIDSYINYFYEDTSSLLDYLEDPYILILDSQRCSGKLDSVYQEFIENYKGFLERGDILPGQGNLLLNKEEVINSIIRNKLLVLSTLGTTNKNFLPKNIIEFNQISLQNYHGQLDLLIDDIINKKKNGFSIIILSGTRPRGERLVTTLRDRGIESVYRDMIPEINKGEVIITFGNQLVGFEFPNLKICVISDKEIFGESKRKNLKHFKKGVGKLKSFTDLKLGDYVVHVNHGIGVYNGIKQLEVEGHKRDYLELYYGGEDKLYVPVEQLDMVQKYIGSEGRSPRINKLGGSEWTKAKIKARKAINEVAEELVKLYAMRSTLKGFSFNKDTQWQNQFEEEFPFQETVDQLSSIEDIKKDMESDKPMDRLLCGDVGYGKTEVALRAAFKAVMDSKQVALLVPTTILAEQHFNNMLQRFSDFPIKIDMLSRFRTQKQQKITLQALKEGNVDILIGTHKLLQKDILFKDLGLLIVDEEQRFGVSHKERIKELKKNIDVLTMTATPIPRTLHMSLTGVRDMSVIDTPPEERYPVQTYVVEFNDQLNRDAILREIGRGGQVYFVYNRVETIKEMAAYLGKLVPEAKIAIGHGQMTERELETVIVDFMKHKYDILVSTTIIETGMDIPNVNTMIICDSDKMGLSQLYQLRGRVGRSNRIAYAYLTYKKDRVLTEVAEKRLKAIKDFTELGSGFKIALRDLEIRGAGNMMGSAQHGHMSSIGYDLYCRMMEETVKLIHGEILKEKTETTIELKVDAYIPSEYIQDEGQKIEIYKKIAVISTKEELYDLQEEIEDRFSDIPKSVYNLMDIAVFRNIAGNYEISEIKEKGSQLIFKFERGDYLKENIVEILIKNFGNKLSFRNLEKPTLIFSFDKDKKESLDLLKEIINLFQLNTVKNDEELKKDLN